MYIRLIINVITKPTRSFAIPLRALRTGPLDTTEKGKEGHARMHARIDSLPVQASDADVERTFQTVVGVDSTFVPSITRLLEVPKKKGGVGFVTLDLPLELL